jgi:catechol 2,3-dioxygenase-like lactoylglutathione lyase family enzyme
MEPVFRKVDCVRVPVPDLEAGLGFYRDAMGHEVIWRTETAIGLRMPDSGAEIVLYADGDEVETDLMVGSVPEAIAVIEKGGGRVIEGPFGIAIGLCAVIEDPWGNRMVILDASRGRLQTDADGRVVGVG